MSSARIDLSSKGVCSAGIDRTMPAIMDPYMQDFEWKLFCDEIDAALRPVNMAQQLSLGFFGLTFVTFFIVMIVGFASFANDFGEFPDTEDSDNGSVAVLFVLPAAMIFLGMAFTCFAGYKSSQALTSIQDICKDTSDRQPRLSFHVRYERTYFRSYSGMGHHDHGVGHHHGHVRSHTTQYIEVSINQNTSPLATHVPVATQNGNGGAVGNTTGYTTAERLAELDKVRNILSPEEYENKRAEIIADL